MRTKRLAGVLVALSITGCGGGGGGGGSTPPQSLEVPFTSFSAIGPRQTVVMPGISQSASVTGSAVTFSAVDSSNTTVKLTYNDAIALTGGNLATPQANFSLSQSAGDTVTCSGTICDLFNASATREVVAINATAVGWNYQTFGVWTNTLSPTVTQVGAFSIGSPTPASAVPTSGGGNFTGLATGFYVDPSANRYVTVATMAATADFGARSIVFSTSSTNRTALTSGAVPAPDAGLDLSGTFIYSAGTNQFTGAVTTSNAALNGSGTGRFYGPNAQEIGGTYSLTGAGGSMLGGFGGKR